MNVISISKSFKLIVKVDKIFYPDINYIVDHVKNRDKPQSNNKKKKGPGTSILIHRMT